MSIMETVLPLPPAAAGEGGRGVRGLFPNAERRLSGYSVTVTVPVISG